MHLIYTRINDEEKYNSAADMLSVGPPEISEGFQFHSMISYN